MSDWKARDDAANVFALFLLMPAPRFENDIAGIDLASDATVLNLAKRYQVPVGAIFARARLAAQQEGQR